MITWKRKTGQYQNGISGYLGKYSVFSIDWDGCTTKNDEKKYKLSAILPGIKIKEVCSNFVIEEQAIKMAENILTLWLERAGLQQIKIKED